MERLKGLYTNKTARTYLIICTIAVALIIGVLLIVFSGSGSTTIDVAVSLKEIVANSQLRTAEYTYNSIAEVKDGDKVKYYARYEGTVVAGTDFEKIEVIREKDVIQVVIPEVKIVEVNIDPKLEYIFTKDKYDTENTYAEATEACRKDLLSKAEANETLLQVARESAKDTIKALTKPLESQLEEGEKFEFVFDVQKEGEEE